MAFDLFSAHLGVAVQLGFLEALELNLARVVHSFTNEGGGLACVFAGELLIAQARLAETGALCNGDMDGRLTRREVPLDDRLTDRMVAARHHLNLSGRGHDRVLRVARTIADLDGRDRLIDGDLDEALSYRLDSLDLLAA